MRSKCEHIHFSLFNAGELVRKTFFPSYKCMYLLHFNSFHCFGMRNAMSFIALLLHRTTTYDILTYVICKTMNFNGMKCKMILFFLLISDFLFPRKSARFRKCDATTHSRYINKSSMTTSEHCAYRVDG